MNEFDERVQLLLARYQEKYARLGRPNWAYPLPPGIPFIGNGYLVSRPRIAIYASAENLSHYERRPETEPAFLKDERRWNRHRAAFEYSPRSFFPLVHIAPVENGGLLCVALFIKQHLLKQSTAAEPWEFIEKLVAANVAKYSIRVDGGANRDYADDRERLAQSLPFFGADLEELKPDLLVIPRSIYKHSAVRDIVKAALPEATVLPVPQFNPTVVNVHLKKREMESNRLARELAGTTLARWTDEIKGFRKGFPYRFYAEVAEVWRGESSSSTDSR